MRLQYLYKRFFLSLKKDSLITTIEKIFNTILKSNKIDLDKINFDENKSLDDLFLIFGTDKEVR